MRIKWFSIIRIIGLCFVLLYHFFIKQFPGGFVGVDIFFTFSGFLITALLIDEFTRSQKIDLIGFYKRRLYRIVPPLVLMILVAVPLALLVRNDFIASIGTQIAATLGFVTNFFEMMAGTSYENQFSPHLFLHTWSLAVEVHFYILWALAVWGFAKISKTAGQFRGTIFLTSSVLFLISFLTMFISSFFVAGFSTIYYATWTHIFPFFLGAVLASLTGVTSTTKLISQMSKKWNIKQTLAVFGAGLLVLVLLLLFLPFNSIWTYLFGFLLASLAASVLIFSARILHEQTPTIDEPLAVTFLADISYSVYLFHWPLFIIFSELTSTGIAVALTLIFSIALSTASFYFLEPAIAGKQSGLFGLQIDLKPYGRWITAGYGLLALLTIGISLFAPKLGNFEKQMIADNLTQADTQMSLTRTAAENSQATDYNIAEGTIILGDSVTVRASSAIQELLPQAQIDAAVSRHLDEVVNLVNLYNDSNTLPENVVVALGTNTNDNYEEILNALVENFPKGHRLIFVTPYDGNYASESESLTYQIGQYQKTLASQYDYITIADWWNVAITNPDIWTDTDLVHFNLESNGATLFAQNIQTALEEAEDKPVKE